ncbi:S-methyl-5-thioribose kinase, partial [Bacillus anthracis]|nr:S-methyl-5-thioribose kinase [Bacillus anthracis]
TWSYLVETFTTLWIGEGVEAYTNDKQWLPIILQDIFTDAVGFAGCELIRRTIGLTHVADLDAILNQETRIHGKKQALSLGKEL